MLGFASSADEGGKSSGTTDATTDGHSPIVSADIISYNDGKLWDEHAEYEYAVDVVTSNGYVSVAKAEKNGVKGYVLIKPSGVQRFMTIDKLKLLGFLRKK